MGSYEAIDKSKQRKKIESFLKGENFVDFGVRKKKKSSKKDIKFDKEGKWQSKDL